MTLQDALRVAFASGLDELLDLMRDRIKAGEFGPAPVLASEHPRYQECKKAIGVLREAQGKAWMEVEAVR